MKRKIFKVLFALMLMMSFSLLTAAPALAANRNFTGPGNFSDATKWDTVPGATDTLQINDGCTVDIDTGLTNAKLVVGQSSAATLDWPAGGTAILRISGAVSSAKAGSAIDMTNNYLNYLKPAS